MYVFSPANKKRLRTNTAYLQTECLNQTSTVNKPPTGKALLPPQQSTTTAPRMPHRTNIFS